MIKDKITSKMVEMEIKDFSDSELHRVFQDCVSQNNLYACAKELIDLKMLTMKDVYFLPCLGNDESMLDETLSGHKYHCPHCNTHLTSLYLCCDCGVRYDWVVAFDEAVEHTLAPDVAGVCRKVNHFYVEGVCANCGCVQPRHAGKA